MKRIIKASKSDSEIFTFRFYFKDGNQQMFDAENIYDALSYVLFVKKQYNATDIWKIEEVED